MQLNSVIFDMDGLLIDSEPYWEEAGRETLRQFGVELRPEQYYLTTGLRTKEWIEYWFDQFGIDMRFAEETGAAITVKAIEKIKEKGQPMPGVGYILSFFKQQQFKIGLATSSPLSLIDTVVDKLHIRDFFDGWSSAENLLFSKPHPEVYLNCAAQLEALPLECICFEDSFNGMIAVKAARMRCAIIPSPHVYGHPNWAAADIKLSSLSEFNKEILDSL